MACGCPSLECQYAESFFCWKGEVRCSEQGAWQRTYPVGTECPAAVPPLYSLCQGSGLCSYEVDVGCGPALFEATCHCLDASYLFDYGNLPALCDCRAITTRALCQRYAQDCIWSEQRAECEPFE